MTASVGDISNLRALTASRPTWVLQVFAVGSASMQKRISRLLSIATDLHVEEMSGDPNYYVATGCTSVERAKAIWAFVTVVDPGAHLETQVEGIGSLELITNLDLATSDQRLAPNPKDDSELVGA